MPTLDAGQNKLLLKRFSSDGGEIVIFLKMQAQDEVESKFDAIIASLPYREITGAFRVIGSELGGGDQAQIQFGLPVLPDEAKEPRIIIPAVGMNVRSEARRSYGSYRIEIDNHRIYIANWLPKDSDPKAERKVAEINIERLKPAVAALARLLHPGRGVRLDNVPKKYSMDLEIGYITR